MVSPYTPPVIVLVYHSQQRKTGLQASEIGFGGESRCPFGVKIADRMQKVAALVGC